MNKSVHLDEIAYCPDSCRLFERIRELPHAAFLDSSFPHTNAGRFDILTAQPQNIELPTLRADATVVETQAYFQQLSQFQQEYYDGIQPASQDIPFCGGILGYLGYNCGNALHGIGDNRSQFPPTQLRAYDWTVIQDHLLQRAVLVSQPQVSESLRRDVLARLQQPAPVSGAEFNLQGRFTSNINATEYQEAFARIQAYIHSGDCYQVNLTQCFSAAYEGDPWHAYRLLRSIAAAPFSAFLSLDDDASLLSLSPERFLSLLGHRVETAPIKGTRPRFSDPKTDEMAAEELRNSAKDRAENLMIVDLLRNDLGRSCVPGSIHVDRLFEIQSFPTVHHLVSTISGELQPGRTAWELLRDSFPGGSITGAPKRRAMEIIDELEGHERLVYCGSLLYISADGRMDSNIAIRSMLCDRGRIRCWGGGGIVADSQWQQEYQETYDKVGKLLTALESI